MNQFTERSNKKYTNDIIEGAPIASRKWLEFDHSIMDTDTTIPKKYKELIAIGVALTTQCPYCLERHTEKAKQLGITKEELSEIIMIVAALRSGAALGYGLLTMKFFKGD